MPDQAFRLRELVQTASPSDAGPAPVFVVVCGGKGGVGTTTAAVEVAKSLASQSLRVALVDADLQHAGATLMLRAESATCGTLFDVLAGHKSATEVLCRPAGQLLVLPGEWASARAADLSASAHDRLLASLRRLHTRADVVVIDVGSGLTPWTDRFWRVAALTLVVTTPDEAAVMDTYSMLKLAAGQGGLDSVRLVVNRASQAQQAESTHQRLARACFRFLGELVPAAPALPNCPLPDALRLARGAAYHQSIRQLAKFVVDETTLNQLAPADASPSPVPGCATADVAAGMPA